MILVLISIVFAVRGFQSEPKFFWSRDFKPLYAGARCLLHNRNPYDGEALRMEYQQAGGDMRDPTPFQPHYSLYPPPAFVLMMPFALFKWQVAHYLFLGVSAGLLIAASFLVASLCAPMSPIMLPILIGIFLLGANSMMMLAQPSMIAIGLCVIGTVLLLQRRYTALAIISFSLSLALKPHTGAFVWLYFFAHPRYRSKAVSIFAVTVLLCLPGVIWVSVMPASAHWLQELRANLKTFDVPGALSDPGPRDLDAYNMTTLQTILSLVRDDKAFYNPASWGVSGVLLLFILAVVRKPRLSYDQQVFAIAALTCLSMLPFYHRTYDTKLLLLCFPALAVVVHRVAVSWKNREGSWSPALLWTGVAAVLCILLENDRYSYKLDSMMHGPDPQHLLKTILLIRNVPVILLIQAIAYLVLLWTADRNSDRLREDFNEPAPVLDSPV
jgi:hypothetical protein